MAHEGGMFTSPASTVPGPVTTDPRKTTGGNTLFS